MIEDAELGRLPHPHSAVLVYGGRVRSTDSASNGDKRAHADVITPFLSPTRGEDVSISYHRWALRELKLLNVFWKTQMSCSVALSRISHDLNQ